MPSATESQILSCQLSQRRRNLYCYLNLHCTGDWNIILKLTSQALQRLLAPLSIQMGVGEHGRTRSWIWGSQIFQPLGLYFGSLKSFFSPSLLARPAGRGWGCDSQIWFQHIRCSFVKEFLSSCFLASGLISLSFWGMVSYSLLFLHITPVPSPVGLALKKSCFSASISLSSSCSSFYCDHCLSSGHHHFSSGMLHLLLYSSSCFQSLLSSLHVPLLPE